MDDWQQAEPVRHQGGLTLFSGSTFVLTDGAGELHEEPHGFFVADRRVLSRLMLGVEGHALEVLRCTRTDENAAQVLRRSTGAGEEMHALLFCTELEVRPGELLVRLLIRNGAAVPREVDWTLRAAADFADIFAVKEARAPHLHHRSPELRGHHRLVIEGEHGLRTELSFREGSLLARENGVTEHLVIPRHTTATFGGIDVRASRAHLVDLARKLDVHVTTRMTKAEIAAALEKESDRRSARARGR